MLVGCWPRLRPPPPPSLRPPPIPVPSWRPPPVPVPSLRPPCGAVLVWSWIWGPRFAGRLPRVREPPTAVDFGSWDVARRSGAVAGGADS